MGDCPNAEWSHRFSPGGEICSYLEKVAGDFDVDPLIRYDTEITRCDFLDGRWRLETAGGDIDTAEFVIAATGVLHHPQYPDIEGIDAFAGAIFHSARWDHDVPLEGKRVGIIGTGSTAVQITSGAGHLVVHLPIHINPPCQVCCMGCYPRCDDSLLDILHIWKAQMLRWCHIAEEIYPHVPCERAPDSSNDMVVSRCNVCDQRPQDVIGGILCDRLHYLDVALDEV